LCGDPAAADDLFQKTFVRFLGATVPIDDADHARAYLYRIATNIVFDHFRALRAEEEWKPEPGSRGESAAILRADMERMFRLLTPQERALLWLAHVEGYDHAEIAKIAGVAPGSVRVLLFRARRRLASILEEHGLSPEVRR
jgi:RNA polymerase sigma-70 factor (ECF subfamily)